MREVLHPGSFFLITLPFLCGFKLNHSTFQKGTGELIFFLLEEEMIFTVFLSPTVESRVSSNAPLPALWLIGGAVMMGISNIKLIFHESK